MKNHRIKFAILMATIMGLIGAFYAQAAPAATQHTSAPTVTVHITAPALMGSMTAPLSSNALGYCGPGITSKSQVVSYYASHPGTAVEMYIRSNRAYYHLQADQSFGTYLNSPHVKVFPAPKGYRIKSNTYCPTSNSIAPYFGHYAVGGVLMLWYCKDVRGYNCVPIAKGYCNNIVTGKPIRPVPKKAPKPKKPAPKKPVVKPTTPSGNCTAINSPGAIVCSNPTYVNVCGTQVVYNGDQSHYQAWYDTYVADHCAPTVTTTTCNVAGSMNYGQPGACIPMPTCQFGGTFPNCSPPPCSVTNTCPPSQFSSTGSTSVQSQKTATAPCPAPNQGIVKTATSDVATLTSPTFTGHGNTQAAADQDLVNQENTWKSSNQSAVDSQAQLQANARLNTALQSCPTTPPCTPSVSVTTINDLDAGGNSPNFHVTVNMCGNDSGQLIVASQFGSVPSGTITVSGLNTYTFTYYAPGEVPPGGQDWVTATVRDSVTGASASTATPKFNIGPPPPTT